MYKIIVSIILSRVIKIGFYNPVLGRKAIRDIRIGSLGGTLCSIWASFLLGDVLQTALMAVVGTVVSYLTSRLLGRMREK